MSLLSHYVGRIVLTSMLMVLVLLLGLDLVFSFLGELEELKEGYQAQQALVFSVLSLPFRLCDMMPIAALIGGIVGLGLLANNAELTVMRAAGISVWRLVWWVIKPAMALVVLSLLFAEYVVPISQQMADSGKAKALGVHYKVGELSSYWQRQGNTFIKMQSVTPDGVLHGVSFYQFDDHGQLQQTQFASEGNYQAQSSWLLSQVNRSQWAADGSTQGSQYPSVIWQSELTPNFLKLVTVSPEYLPPTRLFRYAHYLERQGLSSSAYFLEFWKKALAPIATLSMVLVACSFVFGPLRSVTMGLRIIFGILAGLGFRYLQDFSGYASLVYHFSPLLAAGLPIALSLFGGIVALRRVR